MRALIGLRVPGTSRFRRALLLALGLAVGAAPVLADQALVEGALVEKHIERDGLRMEVRLDAIAGTAATAPSSARLARLRVEATRIADAQPLSGLPLGVWIDHRISPLSGATPACAQRVAGYVAGNLLGRPVLDLNGYWVLTLDAEGRVSVLDPAVSFAGRSSLFGTVALGGKAFDWLRTPDHAALFVAVPERGDVVVVDLSTLAVRERIAVRGEPSRLALQPDARLLWIAYRGRAGEPDGVAVVDVANGEVLRTVALPSGHHEIAFSADSRRAFITSRDAGTLTLFDHQQPQDAHTLELGGQPLSVQYVARLDETWVVDGESGDVVRLDAGGAVRGRIALDRGAGPSKLTPDGRHLIVLNPTEQRVHRIDVATRSALPPLTVGGRPYDVMFTERFAYVRALDAENVALLPLDRISDAPAQFVAMGAEGAGRTPSLPIASAMAPGFDGAGGFFVVPSERTIYHYMEGMNAPDSGLRAYGHTPLAVLLARRGLREVGPGRYEALLSLPAGNDLVLALSAESPRFRECLALAPADDGAPVAAPGLRIEWMEGGRVDALAGRAAELRFRVAGDGPALDPRAMYLALVPGSGGAALRWPVERLSGDGVPVYRAAGVVAGEGGYAAHVRLESGAPLDAMNAPAALYVQSSP